MMTPDKCQSFLMDNVEGMRLFPDKFFDLAICDVWYGRSGGEWEEGWEIYNQEEV